MIPEKLSRVFFGQDYAEFAGMANPEKCPDVASGMLMVDCGASITITESLFDMTGVGRWNPELLRYNWPCQVQQRNQPTTA